MDEDTAMWMLGYLPDEVWLDAVDNETCNPYKVIELYDEMCDSYGIGSSAGYARLRKEMVERAVLRGKRAQ